MLNVPPCTNNVCAKRNECYRYMQSTNNTTIVEYHNICKEPNYKYFYEIGDKEIRKDEIEL